MKTSTISVIVPVYNGEKYLAEAIKSILQQSLQAVEIIVVDDGSTDGSAAVVSEFASQTKYIKQTNKGAASARNHGIKMAKSDLLLFWMLMTYGLTRSWNWVNLSIGLVGQRI